MALGSVGGWVGVPGSRKEGDSGGGSTAPQRARGPQTRARPPNLRRVAGVRAPDQRRRRVARDAGRVDADAAVAEGGEGRVPRRRVGGARLGVDEDAAGSRGAAAGAVRACLGWPLVAAALPPPEPCAAAEWGRHKCPPPPGRPLPPKTASPPGASLTRRPGSPSSRRSRTPWPPLGTPPRRGRPAAPPPAARRTSSPPGWTPPRGTGLRGWLVGGGVGWLVGWLAGARKLLCLLGRQRLLVLADHQRSAPPKRRAPRKASPAASSQGEGLNAPGAASSASGGTGLPSSSAAGNLDRKAASLASLPGYLPRGTGGWRSGLGRGWVRVGLGWEWVGLEWIGLAQEGQRSWRVVKVRSCDKVPLAAARSSSGCNALASPHNRGRARTRARAG